MIHLLELFGRDGGDCEPSPLWSPILAYDNRVKGISVVLPLFLFSLPASCFLSKLLFSEICSFFPLFTPSSLKGLYLSQVTLFPFLPGHFGFEILLPCESFFFGEV